MIFQNESTQRMNRILIWSFLCIDLTAAVLRSKTSHLENQWFMQPRSSCYQIKPFHWIYFLDFFNASLLTKVNCFCLFQYFVLESHFIFLNITVIFYHPLLGVISNLWFLFPCSMHSSHSPICYHLFMLSLSFALHGLINNHFLGLFFNLIILSSKTSRMV